MLTITQQRKINVAAHRGGLLMDEKQPGWAHRVNPDTLIMFSTRDCVLGQSMPAHLTYLEKLTMLGLDLYSHTDYGFSLPNRYGDPWFKLACAWKREIAARTTVTRDVPADAREELILAV